MFLKSILPRVFRSKALRISIPGDIAPETPAVGGTRKSVQKNEMVELFESALKSKNAETSESPKGTANHLPAQRTVARAD